MITLDTLEKWLMEAIKIIEESIDPENYGDIILPLFFYKRFSDLYESQYIEMYQKYKDEEVAKSPMFHKVVIPEGCVWGKIRSISINIGETINNVLSDIAKNNPKIDLVINSTDYNNPNLITDNVLFSIIEHFSNPNMFLSKENVDASTIGTVYENFIKNMYDYAPKEAAKSYTPREVIHVLVECLSPVEGMEIYDPCCGSGGMLLEAYSYIRRQGGDPSKIFLYGQDNNSKNWSIAIMNEFLHEIEANILYGNTFENPKHLDNGSIKKFDTALANPEWNQKDLSKYIEKDTFHRFIYGNVPRKYGDWGWIQHMLASLKPDGRMGIVLDQGALFRGKKEVGVRKKIVENDMVEGVVALPEKLFYNAPAPGCLILFNKDKVDERKGKVLFIYAAEEYEKLSGMNRLREEDVKRIASVFRSFEEHNKYSKVVDLDTIRDNEYNLSVTRYVDIYDEPDVIDIQEVIYSLEEIERERMSVELKLKDYLKTMGYKYKEGSY